MRKIFTISLLWGALLISSVAGAQADRRDVRRGNREFRSENYKGADVSYRKALVKDSTSFAANYNLANTAYRLAGGQDAQQGAMQEAKKFYKAVEDQAAVNPSASDYWFNLGDAALAEKDYQGAVDAFKKSLLLAPDDLKAKENYIYAKSKLEDQQQNGGNNDQNQDQNKDQNQDQQNQDQNNDQNKDQNPDENQDQNQNNQPQNQPQQPQDGQQGISPQQAQQMLQAIQAKEKQTQDKVNKEKAAALQSRQKEKNW